MKIVKRGVNKIVNKSFVIGFVIWLIFSIGLGSAGTLTSVKVATAPVIDGIPETVWDQATAMTVNVSGGANTGSHTVALKSVYTGDSVYFLAKWNDPTENLRRMPWQKQADGTWMQLKTPNAKEGGENTFYEDKFAQIWNINISGFETSGCFATCHAGENSDVKDFGNKYTPNPGELGDIWHMKIVRTNPTGYIDDQYVDSTRYSNATPDAGRHSDPGLAPYYDNTNAAKTAPNFTSADQPAPPYWIFDDQKQPFNDIYMAGDEIAGIIVRPPTGDRADIKGKAVYMDGNWTMEYGRKLTTGSQYDAQFSDLTKEYFFGTAVFDNAQTRHSYETGASKLIFAVPSAPPKLGSISGMKFDDINNNGVRDFFGIIAEEEPGLANWQIDLNYTNGTAFRTTMTDNNGNYSFTNVPPGTYIVQEILQPNWTQTAPSTGIYTVTITSAGENVTGIDFGNNQILIPPPPTVRFIADKNTYIQGEPVTFTIINNGTDTIYLPNSAPWWVENAKTGERVFTPIALDVITLLDPGQSISWTWDQNDSEGMQVPPSTYRGVISSSVGNSSTQEFEILPVSTPTIGSISGSSTNSATGKGLPNWTIKLVGIVGTGVNTKQIRMETMTDSMGRWMFDNLPAGRYIIIEQIQKGFIPVSPPVMDLVLAKGQNSMNNNFTNRPISSLIR